MGKCSRCNKVTDDIHTCTPPTDYMTMLRFVRELAQINVTREENFLLSSWVKEAKLTLELINENHQGD